MTDNRTLILKDSSTTKEALELLQQNGNGFLAVVDEEMYLLGVITDGDIRVALLEGNTELSNLINKSPTTMLYTTPKEEVVKCLKLIRRDNMPLVDHENRLVDVISLKTYEYNLQPNPVVIMAGGLGTRLGEITAKLPKPMLKIGRKPILENSVLQFRSYGFVNIYLSVNYKSQMIKDYFGNGSFFGVNIDYLEEDKKLGTAGALSLLPQPQSEPVLIINGDIITSLNFQALLDFHNEEKADATVCVSRYESTIPYGVISSHENRVESIEEKPTKYFWINAGIYVINPDIIAGIPKDTHLDMTRLLTDLLAEKKKVLSYKIDNLWFDIGNRKDFMEARNSIGMYL